MSAIEADYVVLVGGSHDGQVHRVPAGSTVLTRHWISGNTRRAEQYVGSGRMRDVPTYGWIAELALERCWETAISGSPRA